MRKTTSPGTSAARPSLSVPEPVGVPGGRAVGARPEAGAPPLLTLRVSRDGGRTWSAPRVYRATDRLPPLMSGVWPPCRCPRCAPAAG
ncbi:MULTISPECIES: hypothetical protein [Streptomyces]|uniref:Exo-alpha-sialidase n=1 Tax=Streptomyces changanensis TaxID=2964669 RepID=A0ABY5N4S3_9ACTN|nr:MULTISPECIES: hypothetical protein [Streptomyces]UUS31519.1 hypothetical protein NRO40_12215 [Streptomyces changanensis]